ncbi:hypothetical protein RHMOL_Rhmol11G0213700 [Rhododendron molle]|uniref:Uncharacterized protein n=1 Tax=Rhododendron molle TaxID=49168 RepID=A0ACC0LV11_RHOML|nr:hypothetical protein RHMOL_Rhmol11G0213700 [Rhododendron molle]
MAIFNFQILLYSSLSISFFCILFPQTTSLTFIRFNLINLALPDQKANITTFGNATFSTQGLQLTDLVQSQVGKATYIDRLHLWDSSTSSRNLTDFSTHFVFVIDSEEHLNFAGGFAFFLAPNGSHFEGGGAMGLPIKPGGREHTSPFVAVEFDTYWSGAVGDSWEPVNVGQAPHVASKESDVYSFGIVALEIACGRKPLDSKVPESQMRLVEWVWDLYGMGRLLEAVDEKLGSDFDEQETERLMIVGLWCAHPDHNFRPKIRDAIHVLINFDAPLPILPPKMPALSFFSLPLHTTTTSSDTNQNQFSSNVDSSKFISSSTASSSSIKVFNKE